MNISKNLFIAFVICCFSFLVLEVYKVAAKSKPPQYVVVERNTFEVHKIFYDRQEAETYIKEFKENHDYILQEVGD